MSNLHLQVKGCVDPFSSISGQTHVIQAIVGLFAMVDVQKRPSPAPRGVQEAIVLIFQYQLVRQRFVYVSGDVQDVDMEDVRIVRVMKEMTSVHEE
jgi:hypothetical protein